MKNYVQNGDVLTVIAPAATVSGQPLLIGSLFGVACTAAASGAPVEMRTSGVYDLEAATADVIAAYARVYWDNAAKQVTSTVDSNTLIGCVTEAKAASTTVARVRLNGVA